MLTPGASRAGGAVDELRAGNSQSPAGPEQSILNHAGM